MIEYLKDYLSEEDYKILVSNLKEETKLNFEVMKNNVCEVISFLKELGVTKITDAIINRPDIFLKTKESLQEQFTVIDKNLLIYIFDYDIDDLANFSI